MGENLSIKSGNVRHNVGLSQESRKLEFKNAPEPCHAFEGVSRIIYIFLVISLGLNPTGL